MKIVKEQPIYPLLVFNKLGYLQILHDDNEISKGTLFAFVRGFYHTITSYDRFGNIWKVVDIESKYKKNWFTIFLAYSFFNPRIKIKYKWKKTKKYEIEDLLNKIINYINRDDDILTQYNEKKDLIYVIKKADSFDNIINTIQKYMFEENYLSIEENGA